MRPISVRIISAVILLCTASRIVFAEPTAVQLARDNTPLLSVTISPKASDAVKASAKDLATYLGRISGSEFKVAEGNGRQGIVIGLPQDFDKLPFLVEFGTDPFEREGLSLAFT